MSHQIIYRIYFVIIINIIIIIIIMHYEPEIVTWFVEYTKENLCVKPLLFVNSNPILNVVAMKLSRNTNK